jgi:hypothetical protein
LAEAPDFRWRRAPFVPWGLEQGYENLYPAKIEQLYTRSPYFRRITDDKAGMIQGEGLQAEGPDAEAARELFERLGVDDRFLEAAAFDLALFGGFAAQVLWDPARGRPLALEPQKIARVRAERPGPQGVRAYYVSADWTQVNSQGKPRRPRDERYRPQRIPAYEQQPGTRRQLLFATQYSPVTDFYPLPEAESVYDELSLGTDVVAFQRRYVQNGMTSSALVYVPFVPDETSPGEELSERDRNRMERKRKQIVEDLTGQMRSGQLSIIWFNPYLTDKEGNPTGVPKIEKPVEERNDQKFIEVQQESRQAALTGLGVVARELYGIPSASGFSSQSELLQTAHELTATKLIRPKQRVLLRALEGVARAAGLRNLRLSLPIPRPVSSRLTPEMVRDGLFTRAEFRQAMGYPPEAAEARSGS